MFIKNVHILKIKFVIILCFRTVSENFRIVLVSSTTGQAFQRRIREYPALSQHLNTMWYQHWTREKLVDHAMFHLKGKVISRVYIVIIKPFHT